MLPVRDRADRLGGCIQSVLAQDVPLELIVVDDGSTDDSASVAEDLADDRVTVLRLAESIGAAEARNIGLRIARAPLVAFIDSDTWWPPGRLALHCDHLVASPESVVAVYGESVLLRSGTEIQRVPGHRDTVRDGDLRHVLARYNIIDLPSALLRTRSVRSAGGFDPNLRRFQDWDLFLTLSRTGEFRFVPGVAVTGTDGPDRISRDVEAQYEALRVLVGRHRSLFALRPRERFAYGLQLVKRSRGMRRVLDVSRLARWLISNPAVVLVPVQQLRGRSPVRRVS
ncbi:MAG: glycosyltransferase family 2 protein [Acidimicrobiales bacterium]|nr:glycosyltransferase family 2 protein [Acidimicrobiales bacterium]